MAVAEEVPVRKRGSLSNDSSGGGAILGNQIELNFSLIRILFLLVVM